MGGPLSTRVEVELSRAELTLIDLALQSHARVHAEHGVAEASLDLAGRLRREHPR